MAHPTPCSQRPTAPRCREPARTGGGRKGCARPGSPGRGRGAPASGRDSASEGPAGATFRPASELRVAEAAGLGLGGLRGVCGWESEDAAVLGRVPRSGLGRRNGGGVRNSFAASAYLEKDPFANPIIKRCWRARCKLGPKPQWSDQEMREGSKCEASPTPRPSAPLPPKPPHPSHPPPSWAGMDMRVVTEAHAYTYNKWHKS